MESVPMSERFKLLAMDNEPTGPACYLADAPTGEFRAEVTTLDSPGVWYTNSLKFPDKEAALEYAGNLARRWMMVSRWRAVPDSTPEREAYVEGSEDGRF